MKNYIIVEKNKACAQFTYDNIVKKSMNLNTTRVKKTRIEELSSPSLFHINNNDNIVTINRVIVEDKEQLEYLKNKINADDFDDLLVSNESIVIIVTIVDNEFLTLLKNWDYDNGVVEIISPILIDNGSVDSFLCSHICGIARDFGILGVSKSDVKQKVSVMLSNVDNDYGLVIPFIVLMSTNRDIFDVFIECSKSEISDFVSNFIVKNKKGKIFLWDWKKCFSLNNYREFTVLLDSISDRYGAVVLWRYMVKDLGNLIKIKSLVDNGVSFSMAVQVGSNVRKDYYLESIVKNTSLDVLISINGQLLDHYNSLMNNSFNSGNIVDSLFASMWRLIHVD